MRLLQNRRKKEVPAGAKKGLGQHFFETLDYRRLESQGKPCT